MSKRISKGAVLGTYLQGSVTFCKDDARKKIDCYPFKYVLSEAAKKSPQVAKSDDEKVSKWDEYQDTLRDVKCTWLAKLGEYKSQKKKKLQYNINKKKKIFS